MAIWESLSLNNFLQTQVYVYQTNQMFCLMFTPVEKRKARKRENEKNEKSVILSNYQNM